MKLSDLIKKGSLRRVATATVATVATVDPLIAPSVATVAGVAVANPQKREAEQIAAPVPLEVFREEYRLYTRLAPPPREPTTQPDLEPAADPEQWRELAQAYHLHHFGCIQCQCSGRGSQYGSRCDVGLALWVNYQRSAT